MLKKLFTTLSIVFYAIALLIFVYLLFGNAGAITGQISLEEAIERWAFFPYFYLCLAGGTIFIVFSVMAKRASQRRSARRYYNRGGSTYYKKNRSGSHGFSSTGNCGFKGQPMDDLTRQQFEQFMNEMNRQQQQQFMDQMNMQNQQQQQECMDDANMQQQQFTDEMNVQQDQQFTDEMNAQQDQQFTDGSMDENMKSGTPFEDGGYNMDQGNSFNDFNNGF